MTPSTTTETSAFNIEMLEAQCDPEAARLWRELHGPSCASSHPAVCLVAREAAGGKMLGVAQYFRTSPPEDGCGGLVIVPEERHSDIAGALLHRMVDHAAHHGIRMLGTVVGGDDLSTMDLLRTADLPVTVTRMNGRLYVEIDAFHATLQQNPPAPATIRGVGAARPPLDGASGEITMEAIATLQTEHEAVLYVLDELARAAETAASGRAMPQAVFSDIEEFLRLFVGKCHHAKEETEVFPRLVSAGDPLPWQLEKDHEHGEKLEQAYAEAVASYLPGEARGGLAVQQSAAAYSALLRRHIETERAELFPAMERLLKSQDPRLVAAFEHVEAERIGAGIHERLHGMIGGLKGRIDPWILPVQ